MCSISEKIIKQKHPENTKLSGLSRKYVLRK
jgi:hypothetical protein